MEGMDKQGAGHPMTPEEYEALLAHLDETARSIQALAPAALAAVMRAQERVERWRLAPWYVKAWRWLGGAA